MDLVGRIDVPRLHISAMIAEGTSSRILRVAVGHIPGTALPGQAGNVALAAHRDTFFRHLGEFKSGDLIRVTVPGRQYLYSVKFTDVVRPNETWVVEPSTGQLLTLVTCYPFHYVGPAPERFVVRARRLAVGVRRALFPRPALGAPFSGAAGFPTLFSTASGVGGLVAGPFSAFQSLKFE
jgi:sortase A